MDESMFLSPKQYLEQIIVTDRIIEKKRAELSYLQDLSTSITANNESERVQTSGAGNKIEKIVPKIADLKDEIKEELVNLLEKRREVIKTIEQVTNVNVDAYDVLYMRYVQGFKWDDIANELGYSVDHVSGYLHGKGIEEVRKILTDVNRD